MILLPALLLILWGEPGLCLEEDRGFDGHIRRFTVADDTVYVATEKKLYQLSHDLTPVQSLTLRGIFKDGSREAVFYRVSEGAEWNGTFSINILLPFVENHTLISCGVSDYECGYCEILDLKNISNRIYSENVRVGPTKRSNVSVAFLVKLKKSLADTYILSATQKYDGESVKCSNNYQTVNLHNTNNDQMGEIFAVIDERGTPNIVCTGNVEFVDGFQISSTIYLLSNLPSGPKNTVRLSWLEAKEKKVDTFKSLRTVTLSVSDGGSSRLLSSSLIPGGSLWSGVFTVDGGQTNTELLVFDIRPDFTGGTETDFCQLATSKTLKPKAVLFRQKHMSSVLAVRQRSWMVFFIGTGDGQLIKLAVDKNYHTTCPKVLYRADDDRQMFPQILLDQVDRRHVYVAFRDQMKLVPVSKCSTYTTVQQCWSAQDPHCVWCGSKQSCTFEDDCKDSDWVSIPDHFQQKMVSYQLVKDSTGPIQINVHTHLTVSQVPSNFACQFSGPSTEFCGNKGPPPQFPQCTCILINGTIPAQGVSSVLSLDVAGGTMAVPGQMKE
ncbi:hypothetical protein Q5P01_003433 [Channa striata]|uniref:Sema domain-containing protein n=1 Tax=Channa striata TaxID=64152 RepID=A0AA88NFX7_CHASR|nr:hypothetical protein Q5P01_003433 [Channa striata]